MPARAETVGWGALLFIAAAVGPMGFVGGRSVDTPRIELEIETRVTSVALDACVLRDDPFPSLRAPEDVGNPGGDTLITTSGLRYRPLAIGCGGPSPSMGDSVQVRLAGWDVSGTEIVGVSEPMSFPLHGVVPGVAEGLQLMHIGDRFRLFVPSHLGYGRGMLTFDVELVAIRGPR
jgi:peptidylprolyl isomerase